MVRTLLCIMGLLFSVSIFCPADLHAQTEGEEIEEEFTGETLPYFGIGLGYFRMLTFTDYEAINQVSDDLVGDFTGPFNTDFLGLTFTPGIFPNLRAGLYAGIGNKQLTRQVRPQDAPDTATYTRTVYYTQVDGAIQIDYALTVSSAFTIFPGAMIGYGRSTLGASQTRNSGTNFNEVFGGGIFEGTNPNSNRFARALSYHIYAYPTVNFEYTLTPNIMMRLGAGYSVTLATTDWADEGGVKLLDAPDISTDGPSAQIGLFLGLFQH